MRPSAESSLSGTATTDKTSSSAHKETEMEDEYSYTYRFQVQQEAEKLADARMSTVAYKVGRFGIRCARIFCGLGIAAGAAAVIGNIRSVSDTPFAQLTLDALFKNAGGWILGIVLIIWAFAVAFGEAPQKSVVAKMLTSKAEAAVNEARERARMNT